MSSSWACRPRRRRYVWSKHARACVCVCLCVPTPNARTRAHAPQFNIWEMFLGDCPAPAMRADEYAVSHALSGADVQSPFQVAPTARWGGVARCW